MSTLYYTAKRNTPLTSQEKQSIEQIVDHHNNIHEIKELVEAGAGELFSFNEEPPELGIILEGSTRLPSKLFPDNIDDFIYVAENWFSVLSEIRNTISADIWEVALDDKPLYWNAIKARYEKPAK